MFFLWLLPGYCIFCCFKAIYLGVGVFGGGGVVFFFFVEGGGWMSDVNWGEVCHLKNISFPCDSHMFYHLQLSHNSWIFC